MPEEFQQGSAQGQPGSEETQSPSPDSPAAETDEIDAALADLVDDLGPQSKEAELLADLQRLQTVIPQAILDKQDFLPKNPCSQILSVKFAEPIACMPFPSGP